MEGLAPGVLVAHRYRLSAPLGAGAQGTVWEAVDTRGGAVCAIKFAPEMRDLRGEVTALLAVEHPSLPRALDYGSHGAGSFLALERVVGTPLDSRMDARVTLRALADVASALAALHDAGLTHGDVKPANVLVGAERAWLVDLGFTRATGTGVPMGTLAFMAPEMLAGERGPASDLYALGVTAALTFTGMHPLVDDPTHRGALLQALAQRAAPRDRVIAALPMACRNAVASLLAPNPDARPGSARAFLARVARDAGGDLTAHQRATALALRRERPARWTLVGRDEAREAGVMALHDALAGRGIGVVFVGPEGAGRKRLCEEVMRAAQIAHAASGQLLERATDLPAEPTRPFVVQRIDAADDDVKALARTLDRWSRFADLPYPGALLATSKLPIGLPGLVEITVGALAPEQLATVLEQVAGHVLGEDVQALWFAATEGLPGLAVAMADGMDPATIANASRSALATVRARAGAPAAWKEVAAEVREIVATLALAGEPLTEHDLVGIVGPTVSPGVLAEGVRRGWIAERQGHWEALLDLTEGDVPTAERARIGAMAERFASAHAPGRHALRATAAWLRNDPEGVRTYARYAADGAMPVARAHWLEMLLDVAGDRAAITLELARNDVAIGQPARALARLEGVPVSPDALMVRIDALRRHGAMREAQTLARSVQTSLDMGLRCVSLIALARDALDHGDAPDADALLAPLRSEPTLAANLQARVYEVAALSAWTVGDIARATADLDAAERALDRAPDGAQHARLRSLRGMVARLRGAHAEAKGAYREAWQLAIAAGDLQAAGTYAVNLGTAELDHGGLGEAAQWLARGVRMLAQVNRIGDVGRALANLATLYVFIGDRTAAIDHAQRAERAAMEAGDRVTEALARISAAEVSLEGRAAGDALCTAADAADEGGSAELADEARCRAVIAYANAHEIERAQEVLALVTQAPRSVKALATLTCALAARADAATLIDARDQLRRIVLEEPTLEHELHALALSVRVADALGDANEARRAREAHVARVDALAATLPETLGTLFADAHLVADAPPVSLFPRDSVPPRNTNEARWRRLAEVTREMNSEPRLRPLLERVMDAIIELTGAARGFLLLKGPDGTMRIRTARNLGRRDLGDDEMVFSRSVAERVYRTRESLVTVDATTDRRFDAFESVHAMRLRSILAVPLVVHGEGVGAIYCDDRFRADAFGDDALEIAREFAEAAAVAIQNARTKAMLRRALYKSERLSKELRKRVDEQSVELEATRRALSTTAATSGRYDEIVGHGETMARTLQLVDKVATTAMPVLLLGESGTGKELIARAIHGNSPRHDKPFVAENCGAIPETLLESVLFGHVKGAFTGADRTRSGLFEVADGGTLFLDEIGEMSPSMQAKLLRVLQDGEIRPLGGQRSHKVDVRVVAATHRDLVEMVRTGRFREDLYYRLAVMVIPIPALRQRREDLPELIAYFIAKHAAQRVSVDRRAMARLVSYAWPGNVRQLENEIMRACVLADGAIREDDLSPGLLSQSVSVGEPSLTPRDPLDLRAAIDDLERQLIERAMRSTGGNQSKAAKALGLSRFGLQKKLKRLASPGTRTDG